MIVIVEFRRVLQADYAGLYDLQNRNLGSVLTRSEKSDGFLSAGFEPDEFKALNDDLCVVVCAASKEVLGFLVASTTEFNKAFPLPRTMIERYRDSIFEGRTLDSYRSYISGPVCVERTERGKGIFEGMYGKLFDLLPAEYELAVTLVANDNPRSMNAHQKVGFNPVSQFMFNGRTFNILVVRTKKAIMAGEEK